VIAVAIGNHYGPGGLNLGASLRIQDDPPPPDWQRSIFNGLAQIIVQSAAEPGEIILTAQSDGLSSASVKLESKPCVLRPRVPQPSAR
jgi:hypothetical protein